MSETSFPASVVVLILVTSDRNKCRNSSSEFSLLNDVESSSLLDDVSSLSLEDDNDDDNEDKFSSVQRARQTYRFPTFDQILNTSYDIILISRCDT